ncbi:MAG: DUF6049 family protein [Actinomycetota bacterium]|nr:DUF6049 family protein [Actinomycetota bacterium]
MRCAGPALRSLSCVVVAASLAVPGWSPRASAQEAPAGAISLRLVDQPVWHRPADSLSIRVRIVNRGLTPLDGFLLSLAAHPVVTTRSGLHEAFAGNAGAILSAASESSDQKVDPGDSLVIELDQTLPSLALGGVTEGGVYPLTLTLSDRPGVVQHDSLTTPLIIYPEQPETPLNLALVVPLNELPSVGPDATVGAPLEGGQIAIEEAAKPGGWLHGLVGALEAQAGELPPLERNVRVKRPRGKNRRPRFRTIEIPQRGLHLGVAPTPRLIDELAQLADGYRIQNADGSTPVAASAPTAAAARSLLDRLRALLGEEGIQTLLAPYSFPDLPTLARAAPDRLEIELDEGAAVLSGALGLDVGDGWLFAPGARLGAQTLDEVRFADADAATRTLFLPEAFEDPTGLPLPGCPEAFASFTCPVSVRTLQGPTEGLVADEGLRERFVDLALGAGDRLGLQNFFAETAAIRQELPSIAGRVVQATMPSLWHPRPQMSQQLLAGLREAPWLRTVTPQEAVELAPPEQVTERFVQNLPTLENEPPEEFFDSIEETTELVDSFRRLQPPETLIRRLRRNTLVAESRLWWASSDLLRVAEGYLDGTEAEIAAETQKVTIGGPDQINLTSREGRIPLVVSNQTSFPATVRVAITSPQRDLALEPQALPPQQVAAQDTFQFTVDATARSSGIFQMQVVVETVDGSLEIASKQITIRSTAFNRIALGVTLGALAFLVFFYLLRLSRRRRGQAPV